MADEIISEDQSKKILAKWANNTKVSLVSFKIAPLENQLDGLIGQQFFLTITYYEEEENKKDDVRFFVKTLSSDNPVMYEISQQMQVFEKEQFFYNTFVPALQTYNLKCDYLAESYLCESFIIVLQDLSKLSYTGSGKSGYLNLDHCYACLKTMARFHADGILLQLLKTKELSRDYKLKHEYPVLKETVYNPESRVMRYFYYSSRGILDIANLLTENGTKPKDFKRSLDKAIEDLKHLEDLNKDFKLTITHNDLWANNFLYQYDDSNKVKSCKIIDFQTITFRPPASDFLTFLFMNTRKQFRDEHFDELSQYYYKYLTEFIKNKGFNPDEVLSEEEFKKSCDLFLLPAKIHAVVDRSLTQIPEEIFAEAATSEEAFSNFIFEGRPKYMLEAFNTNDSYRDFMTEDILELKSILFK